MGEPRSAAVAALLMAGLGLPAGGVETGDPAMRPAPVLAQVAPPKRPAPTTSTSTPTAEKGPESGPETSHERDNSADTPKPAMRSGVPEGFEAWMEPQKTLVDIYFGGKLVDSAMVEYTPETIEFLNPERVIRKLPNVTARPILLNHLRGPLPPHGDRVCVRASQEDCGTLEPDFIGVIFDERRFRVDMFVHPDLIASVTATPTTYLGDPDDAGTGLVQNLSINHAGNSEGEDRFSLFGRTLVGHGTQHLFSNWVSTDRQDLAVDELAVRKDFPDHQLSLGLYEPDTELLTILRRQPVAGVGIKRSFLRRRDLDTAFATDVEVFLTTRSRVELLKDERLYDARFYDAGNRLLDTGRLPSGAYNLRIRITEPSGRTRTQERFFVKSRRMAPGGERVWFANIGRVYLRNPLDEFPEDAGTLRATAGLQYRHRDALGLGVATAVIEDAGLLELSADWLSPQWQIFSSLFASTEGSAGWLLRGSVTVEDARLILDSQRVRAEVADADAGYVLLPDSIRRDSAELRLPGTAGGQYFASWRRLQRNDQPEQRTSTLGYTHTLRLWGQQSLGLNASLSRNNGDDQVLLGADWRLITPQWQHQAQLNWRDSDTPGDQNGASARVATTWRDGNTLVDDFQITAGAQTDDSGDTLSLDAQHYSQYGRARAGVTRNQPELAAPRTLSSAGYHTNLVAAPANLAVGGPELNQAGLIIDLRGADGALFDVLVDGKKRFVARGGRRAALTLPGYENYRVAIRDRGTDFVHYDNSSRQITLYPGNVSVLEWQLERIYIVLGTLVRPDGSALGDVLIEGTRGVTATDPDGYFQGEIRGTGARLFAKLNGRRCRLDTGNIRVENGVARLGTVVCRPVEEDGQSTSEPVTRQ